MNPERISVAAPVTRVIGEQRWDRIVAFLNEGLPLRPDDIMLRHLIRSYRQKGLAIADPQSPPIPEDATRHGEALLSFVSIAPDKPVSGNLKAQFDWVLRGINELATETSVSVAGAHAQFPTKEINETPSIHPAVINMSHYPEGQHLWRIIENVTGAHSSPTARATLRMRLLRDYFRPIYQSDNQEDGLEPILAGAYPDLRKKLEAPDDVPLLDLLVMEYCQSHPFDPPEREDPKRLYFDPFTYENKGVQRASRYANTFLASSAVFLELGTLLVGASPLLPIAGLVSVRQAYMYLKNDLYSATHERTHYLSASHMLHSTHTTEGTRYSILYVKSGLFRYAAGYSQKV